MVPIVVLRIGAPPSCSPTPRGCLLVLIVIGEDCPGQSGTSVCVQGHRYFVFVGYSLGWEVTFL